MHNKLSLSNVSILKQLFDFVIEPIIGNKVLDVRSTLNSSLREQVLPVVLVREGHAVVAVIVMLLRLHLDVVLGNPREQSRNVLVGLPQLLLVLGVLGLVVVRLPRAFNLESLVLLS